jgi:hypothetical protein
VPLRIINMIVEATEDVFNKKQAIKLREITMQMANVLRSEVLNDMGDSTLKKVCLDLITKLRLDSNLLNDAKDGPSTFVLEDQSAKSKNSKVNLRDIDAESSVTDDEEYNNMKASAEALVKKKRKGNTNGMN